MHVGKAPLQPALELSLETMGGQPESFMRRVQPGALESSSALPRIAEFVSMYGAGPTVEDATRAAATNGALGAVEETQ